MSDPANPPTTKTVLLVLAGGADPLGDSSALQDAGTPTLDRIARDGLIGRVSLGASSFWDGFVGLLGLPVGAVPLGCAEALGAVLVSSGALRSGALRSGAPSSGALESGILGSGILGTGILGTETLGSAAGALDSAETGGLTGPIHVARADFVTVDDERVLDPRGGGIDDPEAGVLAAAVADHIRNRRLESGRLVRAGGPRNVWISSTPIAPAPAPWCPGRRAPRAVLSTDPAALALFDASRDALERHDVNVVRVDLGENPANALWPHGAGTLPLDVAPPAWSSGARVALVAGGGAIGGLAGALGWDAVRVDADDQALCAAALDALTTHDVVVVRTTSIVAAGVADEAEAATAARRDAHSAVDARLAGPLLGALEERGAFVFAVVADGGLDVEARSFSAEPVPFGILRSGDSGGHGVPAFHETSCRDAGHDVVGGDSFTELLAGGGAH